MKTVAVLFLAVGVLMCMTIFLMVPGFMLIVLGLVCWGAASLAARHEEALDRRAQYSRPVAPSEPRSQDNQSPRRISNSAFGR
jgi:flagellar biosynthesis component FlhA